MKQIIPFTKDITFKTKIGEITGISLENDLVLKGEDLITGNFFITGTYKMIKTSSLEENYSYKIPCDIAISEDYDAYLATIDIDNFTYEIVNDMTLRIKIDLLIDNLEKKEVEVLEPKIIKEDVKNEKKEDIEIEKETDNNRNIYDEEVEKNIEIESNIKMPNVIANLSEKKEIYKTYSVYIVRNGDTIEKIAKNYKVELQDIENYNDINEIKEGIKLVIPCSND